MEFRKISTDDELTELSELASKIWNVHYPGIIGQQQVDYMLKLMYSIETLKQQLQEENIFLAVYENGSMKGYLSFSKESPGKYFIHKWYVDIETQGKGYGRALFDEAFRDIEFEEVRLTVNRQNIQAVNFYFKFGFTIEKAADFDIGNGFYMNDFVMLLKNKRVKD